MKKIIVSAPGKLMLFGEHAVVYGKPCLVTAVSQRMYVTAEILEMQEFELEAPDVLVAGYRKPISEVGKGDIPRGARFVEIAVKNFLDVIARSEERTMKQSRKDQGSISPTGLPRSLSVARNDKVKGIKITTKSEFSSKLGFGSSAAVTVATIRVLSEIFGVKLSKMEIFDLAYKTVIDVQGRGSGFDAAAAIYGGTLYFVTGGKVIEPLDTPYLPLIVGYSGVKADTVEFLKKAQEKVEKEPDVVSDIYNKIENIVQEARPAIALDNWQEVGMLMNKNHEYLRELGVSSEKLDRMIVAVVEVGAYGAKLSGAGGGDCIIALAPEEKRRGVEDAIMIEGGKIIKVNTNAEGVRIE